MKIVPRKIRTDHVTHDHLYYTRTEYSDGRITWECDDLISKHLKGNKLEKLYQKLINKPVETNIDKK